MKQCVSMDHLFMDCNSIIYDAVHETTFDGDHAAFENLIIERTIKAIDAYIQMISPSKSIFIAFDGVAPFAKMNQQKQRRYKSHFMANQTTNPTAQYKWDTSAITPGTQFMKMLSTRIEYEFKHKERKYNVDTIIVSCSNEAGEGEHKLMDQIREQNRTKETVMLYGLDADLIMLSMIQLPYCSNIYVFREAPEFIKHSIPIDVQSDTSNLYFLDMHEFSRCLLSEMDCVHYDRQRVYDYVFMCFLLGNDFLPHFPAINIRTHGIDTLIDIYRCHIGKYPDRFLISRQNKIQWKIVGILFTELAKLEKEKLLHEYFVRDKFDKRQWPSTTPEEKEQIVLNIPVMFRAEEKYICPQEPGWETRYYKSLLHNVEKKEIVMNYLEGLEWVYKYYSVGCPDWKWKYHYHYPPLCKDVVPFIPHFETDFIEPNQSRAFLPELQLSYVLPKSQLHLLPDKIAQFLRTNYDELYPEAFEFQWAFCRYFWEAHPLLPDVPLSLLEQWDRQFRLCLQNVTDK